MQKTHCNDLSLLFHYLMTNGYCVICCTMPSLQKVQSNTFSEHSNCKVFVSFCFGFRLGGELRFEDPNLTAMVSENLEKIKRRQVACLN